MNGSKKKKPTSLENLQAQVKNLTEELVLTHQHMDNLADDNRRMFTENNKFRSTLNTIRHLTQMQPNSTDSIVKVLDGGTL